MIASVLGTANDAIVPAVTTMTRPGGMKPAWTADCPNTSAPTMLTAGPKYLGRRTPASLINSIMISAATAFTDMGKGVPTWVAAIFKSNCKGISSW